MQTSEFLFNTDFSENSGGYLDIMQYRFQPYCNTAGVVVGANALIAAIVAERNNVHTLLADGVVDPAIVIVAAAADDKGKMLFITKQLIDTIEASVPFSYGLDTDNTVNWLSITPVPSQVLPQQDFKPKLFRSFVNHATNTNYGYTANTRTLRLATLDAAYALYALVNALP